MVGAITDEKAGLAIRRRMRELGLSQKELGARVGKSQAWVSQELLRTPEQVIRYLWARDPEAVQRLLHALQLTPEEFSRETGIQLPGAVSYSCHRRRGWAADVRSARKSLRTAASRVRNRHGLARGGTIRLALCYSSATGSRARSPAPGRDPGGRGSSPLGSS